MPEKPSFAYDYKKENVELVRQTCLYVATKLGDSLDDLVVVGGLVPSLLIPDESLPAGEDVHIGTMDLDLGLSLAILDRKRYEDLTLRLHRSGFTPDENEEGNPTLQRWKVSTSSGLKVTVDFLIGCRFDSRRLHHATMGMQGSGSFDFGIWIKRQILPLLISEDLKAVRSVFLRGS